MEKQDKEEKRELDTIKNEEKEESQRQQQDQKDESELIEEIKEAKMKINGTESSNNNLTLDKIYQAATIKDDQNDVEYHLNKTQQNNEAKKDESPAIINNKEKIPLDAVYQAAINQSNTSQAKADHKELNQTELLVKNQTQTLPVIKKDGVKELKQNRTNQM